MNELLLYVVPSPNWLWLLAFLGNYIQKSKKQNHSQCSIWAGTTIESKPQHLRTATYCCRGNIEYCYNPIRKLLGNKMKVRYQAEFENLDL